MHSRVVSSQQSDAGRQGFLDSHQCQDTYAYRRFCRPGRAIANALLAIHDWSTTKMTVESVPVVESQVTEASPARAASDTLGVGGRVALLTRGVLLLLRIYRYAVSPFLGSHCRFFPSCSEYMQQAVSDHGLGKGVFLGVRRLACCHPWHRGGCDPVPPVRSANRTSSGR